MVRKGYRAFVQRQVGSLRHFGESERRHSRAAEWDLRIYAYFTSVVGKGEECDGWEKLLIFRVCLGKG